LTSSLATPTGRSSSSRYGRGATKQHRLVFAARYGLRRFAAPPACRFDVVCVEGERIEWLRAAFDAA
jgi:Holliday junction resolvase-like predicted endonuclease